MKKTTFLTLGQWQTKIRIDGYSKSLHLTFVVRWKISKMKYNGRISCMSFLSLTHKWIQCQKQCSISLWSSFPWNHTRTNRTQSSHHAIRSFIPPSFLSSSTDQWMKKKQHPAMTRAITTLHSKGKSTFLCLSNSNSIFISTILNSKIQSLPPQGQPQGQPQASQPQPQAPQPLSNLFAEIITNPATWQGDLLKLDRRIPPSSPHQHTCQIGCSPNMCKGKYNQSTILSFCFLRERGSYNQKYKH